MVRGILVLRFQRTGNFWKEIQFIKIRFYQYPVHLHCDNGIGPFSDAITQLYGADMLPPCQEQVFAS